jgi:replication factor A1
MTEDIATFLITRDHKIIAQVRLTSRGLGCLVKPEMRNLRFEDSSTTKWGSPQAEDLEIKDLSSETKRFNLNAKVTEKSSPRPILSRWGNTLLLSTATITDRTGTIKLPLWKDQINRISVGDRIHIENARLERFRGQLQVRVDKLTRLSVIENQQNKKQLTTKT